MEGFDLESQVSSDDAGVNSDKLVPVSEAIRYRKRAQIAEKKAAELQEQLREAVEKKDVLAGKVSEIKLEHDLADKLITAGARLSGKSETYGDASVMLPIFPYLPVTYVIWQGDDEISSSASILFDANVNSYLPCEDIVLAASFGVYELMKVAGSL